MVADTLGNYLVTVKNASIARKETLVVPFSKLKMAITDVLQKEGYMKNLTSHSKATTPKEIEISLAYTAGKAKIKGIERVSRPSKRVYHNVSRLETVKNGFGHLIVSTSKGIMTGKEARKAGLGGEVLFKIW